MRSKKLRILNFAKQERPTPEEMGEDGEGGGEGSRMESMGFTRLSNLAPCSISIPGHSKKHPPTQRPCGTHGHPPSCQQLLP